MKRTYKFRGQSLKEYDPLSRTKKGTWLEGDLHTQDEYAAIDNGKFTLEVDPATVGQFCGIIDTSTPPKEIYDGDIIEGKSGIRHLVKYDDDSAAFLAYKLPLTSSTTAATWKFDDNTQAWDDEWIYIFLGAFIVYLAASAIINKYKNNNKND